MNHDSIHKYQSGLGSECDSTTMPTLQRKIQFYA